MKKRLFALLCVAVMALAALPLSGCHRRADVKKIDETKTQRSTRVSEKVGSNLLPTGLKKLSPIMN